MMYGEPCSIKSINANKYYLTTVDFFFPKFIWLFRINSKSDFITQFSILYFDISHFLNTSRELSQLINWGGIQACFTKISINHRDEYNKRNDICKYKYVNVL